MEKSFLNRLKEKLPFTQRDPIVVSLRDESVKIDDDKFRIHTNKKTQEPQNISDAEKEAHKLSLRFDDRLFAKREKAEGITIDSPSSKDLDDAIYVEDNGDKWLMHVSIADVEALVKPESYIDNDAFEKVYTRYKRHGNDPMIPHILSENKLSLLENEKRPTITFVIPVDKKSGAISDPRIHKTYVESQKRFSYDEVDNLLRDENTTHPLKQQLQTLQNVTHKRMQSKKGTGSHASGSSSHNIVQEAMLLANESVARYCAKHNIPILFRNQTNGDTINASQKISWAKKMLYKTIQACIQICEKLHIPLFSESYAQRIRKMSQTEFHKEVLHAGKNPTDTNSTVQKSVHTIIVPPAQYSTEAEGHMGLDMPAYTHVTSPIRRYADLVNHRILSAIAENSNNPKAVQKNVPYSEEELSVIADHINKTTQRDKEEQKQRKIQKKAA